MSSSVSAKTLTAPAPPEGTVRGLKPRQLAMMGLGGAIGAGLFLGSGKGVAVAGPAVLISYTVAGALVVLIMWMIGELSANNPASGAFSTHAETAFGPVAGFTVGWLYWMQLAVVVAAEAVGAAAILTGVLKAAPEGTLIPPAWLLAFIFMAVLTAVNMFGVAKYGEFEFWFALIKVAVIVAFLAVGILFLFGISNGATSPGLSNFSDFAPSGLAGVGAGLLIVIFAFGGTEIVAIAAGETKNPEKSVVTAIHTVAWRICLFYIGSVFIIVAVLPPAAANTDEGPFAAVLNMAGLPAAGTIMSLVAVFALLSALNANIYAASRILYSLAHRKHAPAILANTTTNNVPRNAVLLTVAFGFIAAVLEALFPGKILDILLMIVGSTMVVVWTSIAVSQIKLRRLRDRQSLMSGQKSTVYKMPLFPYLSYAAVAILGGVVIIGMLDGTARIQLLLTFSVTALIAVCGIWLSRRSKTALSGRQENA